MKNKLRRLTHAVLVAIAFTLTAFASTAYTEKVLYSFPSVGGLPVWPQGLVADSAGNFYGFSEGGGAANLGAIFELSPGATGWTQTVLYSFSGGQDGEYPNFGAVPLMDAKDNLYGEDFNGGADMKGEIYELSPSSGGWTKTVLYSFTGLDGWSPVPSLIFDAAGNLYGATSGGGIYDEGVIFQLSPSPSGWNETVLYAFEDRATGFDPIGQLAIDSAGRLYGMTYFGGPSNICSASGCGTIFQLSPPTSGTLWTYKRLHAFDFYDGGQPTEANNLVFDAAGNLYGCTSFGGNSTYGAGVIFKLSPTSTGAWKETVLHSFGATGDNSYEPNSITFDASGHLWGTAIEGGSGGEGTVFELIPTANGHWILNTVYSFPGTPDGRRPGANVVFDNAGNVYGTTSLGGTSSAGAFFELSPASSVK
jgi:uncharacterized repeat protein (TIGR03803 family)